MKSIACLLRAMCLALAAAAAVSASDAPPERGRRNSPGLSTSERPQSQHFPHENRQRHHMQIITDEQLIAAPNRIGGQPGPIRRRYSSNDQRRRSGRVNTKVRSVENSPALRPQGVHSDRESSVPIAYCDVRNSQRLYQSDCEDFTFTFEATPPPPPAVYPPGSPRMPKLRSPSPFIPQVTVTIANSNSQTSDMDNDYDYGSSYDMYDPKGDKKMQKIRQNKSNRRRPSDAGPRKKPHGKHHKKNKRYETDTELTDAGYDNPTEESEAFESDYKGDDDEDVYDSRSSSMTRGHSLKITDSNRCKITIGTNTAQVNSDRSRRPSVLYKIQSSPEVEPLNICSVIISPPRGKSRSPSRSSSFLYKVESNNGKNEIQVISNTVVEEPEPESPVEMMKLDEDEDEDKDEDKDEKEDEDKDEKVQIPGAFEEVKLDVSPKDKDEDTCTNSSSRRSSPECEIDYSVLSLEEYYEKKQQELERASENARKRHPTRKIATPTFKHSPFKKSLSNKSSHRGSSKSLAELSVKKGLKRPVDQFFENFMAAKRNRDGSAKTDYVEIPESLPPRMITSSFPSIHYFMLNFNHAFYGSKREFSFDGNPPAQLLDPNYESGSNNGVGYIDDPESESDFDSDSDDSSNFSDDEIDIDVDFDENEEYEATTKGVKRLKLFHDSSLSKRLTSFPATVVDPEAAAKFEKLMLDRQNADMPTHNMVHLPRVDRDYNIGAGTTIEDETMVTRVLLRLPFSLPNIGFSVTKFSDVYSKSIIVKMILKYVVFPVSKHHGNEEVLLLPPSITKMEHVEVRPCANPTRNRKTDYDYNGMQFVSQVNSTLCNITSSGIHNLENNIYTYRTPISCVMELENFKHKNEDEVCDYSSDMLIYNVNHNMVALNGRYVANLSNKDFSTVCDGSAFVSFTIRRPTIVNSGYSNVPFISLTNEEIIAEILYTEFAVYGKCGRVPKYFYPPFNQTDDRVNAVVTALGYRVVDIYRNIDTPYIYDEPEDNSRESSEAAEARIATMEVGSTYRNVHKKSISFGGFTMADVVASGNYSAFVGLRSPTSMEHFAKKKQLVGTFGVSESIPKLDNVTTFITMANGSSLGVKALYDNRIVGNSYDNNLPNYLNIQGDYKKTCTFPTSSKITNTYCINPGLSSYYVSGYMDAANIQTLSDLTSAGGRRDIVDLSKIKTVKRGEDGQIHLVDNKIGMKASQYEMAKAVDSYALKAINSSSEEKIYANFIITVVSNFTLELAEQVKERKIQEALDKKLELERKKESELMQEKKRKLELERKLEMRRAAKEEERQRELRAQKEYNAHYGSEMSEDWKRAYKKFSSNSGPPSLQPITILTQLAIFIASLYIILV